MSTKTNEELNVLISKYCTSRSRSKYGTFSNYLLPMPFQKICKDIEDLEVFEDDVWVCSFPKCGTTWMQEMVWCICNNLDFEAAKEDLDTRFVFLEFSALHYVEDMPNPPVILAKSVEAVKNMKRPRFIKTHLPWELLPKQIQTFEKRPKIVHILRNPMDASLSNYHFSKLLGSFTGDMDVFFELFLNHKVIYTPFHKYVLSYWSRKAESNILIIMFEDMKADLSAVVDRVGAFFGITLAEEGKRKLLSHLSFDSMKNSSANHALLVDFVQKNNEVSDTSGKFMRSGKSGGYRSEMTEEIVQRFKKQFLEKLEAEDLKYSL